MPDPAAAHIFPFETSKNKNFSNLNAMLTAFWGTEKSLAWREEFQNADITQSAKNGISMNSQIHFWFDNARFALKPLRKTPEAVVVQWHWLKRAVLKPRTHIRPDQDIFLQAGLTDQNWGECLAHRRSGVPIRTGQTFILRAENPEDLPSWELLQMQWDLLRVAAICGAADVTDDYYDLDEEDCAQDQVVAAIQNAIFTEHGARKGGQGRGVDRDQPGERASLLGSLNDDGGDARGKGKEDSPRNGKFDSGNDKDGGDDDGGDDDGGDDDDSGGDNGRGSKPRRGRKHRGA